MLPTPGWPRARATGQRGPGRRVGAQRLPAAPAAGAKQLSRSFPRTRSLPALTQQDASRPGHPASPPAPAHHLPGPAASAEPAPLRWWQGHPVQHCVSCVGTASPTAPSLGLRVFIISAPSPGLRVFVISAPPVPAPAGLSGHFGCRTQWAAAEPASVTVLAGLGDTFWQGQGGNSSQTPTHQKVAQEGPSCLLDLALAWHGTAWHGTQSVEWHTVAQ